MSALSGTEMMQNYNDLVELARICASHARQASTKQVAAELWRMADMYRTRAMALDSGKSIDIGPPPERLGPHDQD
jgi:hypothetical protein